MRIARQFAALPGRHVHYRRCGEGPPLVLIHQSPQDSSEFEPLMALLGERFTVFAPDTPGYGLSDPIAAPDEEPELDRFVDALAEWLDAARIARAAFYGFHSGATIATRLAARRPDRVASLVLNGVALLAPEERRDILARYLPRFAPSWDGSHLTWLWARLREQSLFFPWYTGHAVEGGVGTGASLDEMEAHLHTFLGAGDDYRTAYRAVFAHPSEPDLARLRCPVTALVEPGDVLEAHLERWRGREAVRVRHVDGVAAIAAAIAEGSAPEASGLAGDATVSTVRRMIALDDGVIHVRIEGEGNGAGRPILLLHDAASSGRALASLVPGLRDDGPVIVPDLPHHGASHGFAPDLDEAGIAERVDAMLEALGVEADIVSVGSAVAVGAALAGRSARIGRFVAINPIDGGNPGCTVTPEVDADGAQLQAAWRLARGIGFGPDAYWPTRALAATGSLATLAATQQATVDILSHVRQIRRGVAPFVMSQTAVKEPNAVIASKMGNASGVPPVLLSDNPVHWPVAIRQVLDSC
jgi:pimeloyl-ACP methyl ester carboxylesterase